MRSGEVRTERCLVLRSILFHQKNNKDVEPPSRAAWKTGLLVKSVSMGCIQVYLLCLRLADT